jgi:PPOX class probable F420-dependent enzyme
VTANAPAWALALLREARVGRLATADASGQPLVVPVCYALDTDAAHLYSAIDAKPKRTRQLRRLRNIGENPRVSVVVDEYDEDWSRLRYVIVEGGAAVIEAGPTREHAIDLLLEKYPQYLTLGLAADRGPVVAIAVERIVAWRYA